MTHLTLTILSLCLGYTQAGMYVFGMGCILWEIISKMTSSGLSKDFLILQLFGFSYMAFQDQFGFWAPESSYSTEVHVSDLCISFIGLTWICLCMAAVHVVPQDQNNKNNTWTWMGWAPCAASVLTIVIVILTGGELDSTCIVMGTLKSAFSLVSYIP
jgi:predicted small integral membrane protein